MDLEPDSVVQLLAAAIPMDSLSSLLKEEHKRSTVQLKQLKERLESKLLIFFYLLPFFIFIFLPFFLSLLLSVFLGLSLSHPSKNIRNIIHTQYPFRIANPSRDV